MEKNKNWTTQIYWDKNYKNKQIQENNDSNNCQQLVTRVFNLDPYVAYFDKSKRNLLFLLCIIFNKLYICIFIY